jgi:hypothetical protein
MQRVKVSQSKPTQALAFCPAHEDVNTASLSIKEGRDGRVLLKCFAGCNASEIVQSVDLKLRDLYPWTPGQPQPKTKPCATRSTLKAAYHAALASIVQQRDPTERDAPRSTHEMNRARALAEFKFSNVSLSPKTPLLWEIRPPWDRDPLWPLWFEQELLQQMLEDHALSHPDAPPGEVGGAHPTPQQIAAAANRTAIKMARWAADNRLRQRSDPKPIPDGDADARP